MLRPDLPQLCCKCPDVFAVFFFVFVCIPVRCRRRRRRTWLMGEFIDECLVLADGRCRRSQQQVGVGACTRCARGH